MAHSIRVRYRREGGHIYARVFSSEFGADTAHGLNGELAFRPGEWDRFAELLALGAHYPGTIGTVHVLLIDDLADEGTGRSD